MRTTRATSGWAPGDARALGLPGLRPPDAAELDDAPRAEGVLDGGVEGGRIMRGG
jgi:hypothetical protein